MINYLLGFYATLSEMVFFATTPKDNYLKFNRSSFQCNKTNRELMYNIHIRLGDLYRYGDSRSNAQHFYLQALQIDPRRGTAYNQFALCTPLTKPYKLLYFTLMAFQSSIDSVKIAEHNFNKALSRVDNPIFEQLRSKINLTRHQDAIEVSMPEIGAEWFYLCVISIQLNDFNSTLVFLLDWILDLTQKNVTTADLDYSLMALDVALDWILKGLTDPYFLIININYILLDRNNLLKKESLEQTLRLIGNQFKVTLKLDDPETNQKLIFSQQIALKHNFILKDFLPLKDLYEKLIFIDDFQCYVVKRDRKVLTTKLIHKLRNF